MQPAQGRRLRLPLRLGRGAERAPGRRRRLLGAAHGFEIPFVFGHWDLGSQGKLLFSAANEPGRAALSQQMMCVLGRVRAQRRSRTAAPPGAPAGSRRAAGRTLPRARHRGGRRRPHGARHAHGRPGARRDRTAIPISRPPRTSAAYTAAASRWAASRRVPSIRARATAPARGSRCASRCGLSGRQPTGSAGAVYVLELQPVGIGEEDRVVARAVRVLRRRIEDRSRRASTSSTCSASTAARDGALSARWWKPGAQRLCDRSAPPASRAGWR